MKQKVYSILLAILMSMAANVAMAYDAEIDSIYYNFNGTEAEVTSGDNKYTCDVVIPESVTYNETAYSVVSIGDHAFSDCYNLTSITIPNSVTSIGKSAFLACTGLTSITIPNSVTTIGESAFWACTGLTSITIGNRVSTIESFAFSECYNLTSFTIPNSVTCIGHSAFQNCRGLTSISIPNSVTSIGSNAFWGCDNLTSITIDGVNASYISEDGVLFNKDKTTILRYPPAKSGTAYVIPNSVTSIGWGAFQNCRGLTSISIPNSVISIEGYAFQNCSGLPSITIPNSVMSIEQSAFSGCSGLTSVIIPNSVTYLDEVAFSNCVGLTAILVDDDNPSYTSVDGVLFSKDKTTLLHYPLAKSGTAYVIPNSVTRIGDIAFHDCSGLISITIPNSVTTIGNGAFGNCSGLTSITIPNSVRLIGPNAFSGCSGLTLVTIPNSVTSIEWGAFDNCSGLTDVYCYAKDLPMTNYWAFGYPKDITLHVPIASIDTYRTTEPWSEFKEIVESDKLDVTDLNIKAGDSNTQEISLNNGLTNLVGFQMDLTLPEGVGIDKTGCALSSRITDEEQELTIGKLESGAYRITSTSFSLTPISGNDGTLLSLKLTAEDGCIGGQATISNIIFSTAESEKVVMSDKTFDIDILYNLTYKVDGEEYKTSSVAYGTALTAEAEPTKEGYTFGGWSEIPETMPNHDVEITGRFYLYGDVNTDEDVDVVDVVDIARFVVATPSVSFREKLADLNKDNTVNIADAMTLVNYIAGDQNFARAMTSYDYNLCQLQLLNNGTNTLSLCLDGNADFTAFQFEVELPENTDITAMRINGLRMDDHQILYNKVADNRYRVAVLSLSNAIFKGNEGELLNISIDGQPTNEISVHDILFVTTNGTIITFDDISLTEATGIANVSVNDGNNVIYDLQGRKLSRPQRGVYIDNGKKVVVK